jgi:N-acetylglucosaminyl-diphospho-decaprenol L-rhamnosyltransferase
MTNVDRERVLAAGTPATVAVIVVAYNSGPVLRLCLDALDLQTRRPDTVLVIDNNSPDTDYLDEIPDGGGLRIIRNNINEGFCAANNRGFRMVGDHSYTLFLNPDAFLHRDFIERAVEWMERPESAQVAILTGTLLGFDIGYKRRTGAIDSTGVFQTWYGKWYDRGQGEKWVETRASALTEDVPAIAGALMFCRSRAIESIRAPNGDVFDGRFFMYKEDIDLSLRLRKRGWRLVYWPALVCDHCRGWQGRRNMSTRARYMSARNELRVCFANNGRGVVYSTIKFLFVPLEDIFIKLLRFINHRPQ